MDATNLERAIRDTGIDEVAFLRRPVIRRFKNVGIETLGDLLSMSDGELEDSFDGNSLDDALDLKEMYEKKPEKLLTKIASSRSSKTIPIRETVIPAQSTHSRTTSTASRTSRNAVREAPTAQPQQTEHRAGVRRPLIAPAPDLPFAKKLEEFEQRAKEAFEDLEDQDENVMAYQAFDYFPAELDEVAESFKCLFERYKNHVSRAFELITNCFPNIYIIFVAERAQTLYSENNLWGNVFDYLGLSLQNHQVEFKRIFFDELRRRRMPIYAQDEARDCYFYTALLHGGLSEQSWLNLWKDSLIPLAKDMNKSDSGYSRNMSGYEVLRAIRNTEGRFAAKVTELKILSKAPDSLLAPLFESAMKVVSNVVSQSGGSGSQFFSGYDLPDVAMVALKESLQPALSRNKKHQDTLYTRDAKLELDLDAGTVHLRWNKQQLPLSHKDDSFEFYVNGKLKKEASPIIDIGKCILPEIRIDVEPQTEYHIETRRIVPTESDEKSVANSFMTTIERSKPGCFEFIQDNKGRFRLRKQGERILKTRKVAFLMRSDYSLEPGSGMVAIQHHIARDSWGNAKIILCTVEPGASGSIIDTRTGETIAAWRERYLCHIDKKNVIGKTSDNYDLYGFTASEYGTNDALPIITVSTFDGNDAINDLVAECTFNGERIALPRKPHPLGNDIVQIEFRPDKVQAFSYRAGICTISLKQKSADMGLAFKHTFAIAPIRSFHVSNIRLDHGLPMANYVFWLTKPAILENIQGDTFYLEQNDPFETAMLLSDDKLSLRLTTEEAGCMDFSLFLAGIELNIPNTLKKAAQKRPICLSDALELGTQAGEITLNAKGNRESRKVLVLLGEKPVDLHLMKQQGTYTVGLFRDKSLFKQRDHEDAKAVSLVLSLSFGGLSRTEGYEDSWQDMTLLECQEGFGFKTMSLQSNEEGSQSLALDEKTLSELHVKFTCVGKSNRISEEDINEGETAIPIPQEVSRGLAAGRTYTAEITPSSWFGDPLYEYTYTTSISKKAGE